MWDIILPTTMIKIQKYKINTLVKDKKYETERKIKQRGKKRQGYLLSTRNLLFLTKDSG